MARRTSVPLIASESAGSTVSGPSDDNPETRPITPSLQPILHEIERLRQRTQRSIRWRIVLLVPLGLCVGLFLGLLLAAVRDKDLDRFAAVMIGLVGGGAGGFMLAHDPQNRKYRSAYKTTVLPLLAAPFGNLDYRKAVLPDLRRFVALGFLPIYVHLTAEDEIFGTYRGVGVSIIEIRMSSKGIAFDGLIVQVGLPGRLKATTVVSSGTFIDTAHIGRSGLRRIRLEDPEFERLFQVYGSDQVEARVLLTPALMERMMTSIGRTKDASPRFLAEPGTFWAALPKISGGNLFEPPDPSRPLDHDRALAATSKDMESALRMADAVIDLHPSLPLVE